MLAYSRLSNPTKLVRRPSSWGRIIAAQNDCRNSLASLRRPSMKEPLFSPPGSAPLGASVPSISHALSVSLPTWKDNVDWAEGNARVVDVMSSGYPRFFVQRNIQKLARICLHAIGNESDMAMLFPTTRTAEECCLYMRRKVERSAPQLIRFHINESIIRSHESGVELVAVCFSREFWKIAKSFWQHTGMGISSRYGDMILGRLEAGGKLSIVDESRQSLLNLSPDALEEKRVLRHRIAGLINANRNRSNIPPPGGSRLGEGPAEEDNVFLYPTGMSAIWHAQQMGQTLLPGRRCICFGFSYTDTIKIIERWSHGSASFLDSPDKNLKNLENFLPDFPTAALFCEVPSNPLLETPDLPRLRALADKYGFLISVDETVGNFVNVDVFQYADIVTTSLSKLFSGSANVMGGSLVINPNSAHFGLMSAHLRKTFMDDYYCEDAVAMEENSRDFAQRVDVINTNAVAVAEFLRNRSLAFAGPGGLEPSANYQEFVIKEVFFPKWVTRENYDLCRKLGNENNFGPLLSITFTSPEASHAFFNALQCAKGPSLGTNFTLACPYTILAHYNELQWAATYGIEEGIVRISVGMESREVLIDWMRVALDEAEKNATIAPVGINGK